jgi:hypothetical protein
MDADRSGFTLTRGQSRCAGTEYPRNDGSHDRVLIPLGAPAPIVATSNTTALSLMPLSARRIAEACVDALSAVFTTTILSGRRRSATHRSRSARTDSPHWQHAQLRSRADRDAALE